MLQPKLQETNLTLTSKEYENIIIIPKNENFRIHSFTLTKKNSISESGDALKTILPKNTRTSQYKGPGKRLDPGLSNIHLAIKKTKPANNSDIIFQLKREIGVLESQLIPQTKEEKDRINELENLCEKWKIALVQAIQDFKKLVNEASEIPISNEEILDKLGIDDEFVGFNRENDEFT